MKIVVNVPLTQVIRQRNIKEKAFNDSLGFKSRCRTLDKCNHFENRDDSSVGQAREKGRPLASLHIFVVDFLALIDGLTRTRQVVLFWRLTCILGVPEPLQAREYQAGRLERSKCESIIFVHYTKVVTKVILFFLTWRARPRRWLVEEEVRRRESEGKNRYLCWLRSISYTVQSTEILARLPFSAS